MTDPVEAGGSGQPDAFERMKTLSEDKRRLLDAMMRQRAAESGKEAPAAPPAGGPRAEAAQASSAGAGPRPFGAGAFGTGPFGAGAAGPGATGPGLGGGFTTGPVPDPAPNPLASLIAIKASGSRPPFFCVHGILGSAFPYFRLALHLDADQPFYGLQAPGLDGTVPPLDSIEAMARHYIGLIRGVQPRGPYYLGGYSFGGWVAFEMAQQLVAAGETVDFLVMIGTGAPLSTSNPRLFEQVNFLIRYSEDYQRLVTNSFIPDAARAAPQAPPPTGMSPVATVAAVNNVAQYRYMPRPYSGRLTLLLTGEQHAAAFPETTLGWKMLTVHEVPVHLVSGNHLNMFEEPHVRDVGEKLSACLRQRQRECAGG